MAQLTSITLRNFKGIGEHAVKVPMRPITLLFGPNSAGKSTVLQAMQYAREILKRNNVNPDRTMAGGDAIDLGGFEGLVHRHDLNRTVEMTFEFAIGDDGLPSPMYLDAEREIERQSSRVGTWTSIETESSSRSVRLFSDDDRAEIEATKVRLEAHSELNVGRRVRVANVSLVIAWDKQRGNPFLQSVLVHLDGQLFGRVTVDGAGQGPYFVLNLDHPLIAKLDGVLGGQDNIDEVGTLRQTWLHWTADDPEGVPPWLIAPDGFRLDKDFLIDVGEATGTEIGGTWLMILDQAMMGPVRLLTQAVDSMRYLGPVREVPRRGFQPHRHPSEHRWASGLGAWDALHRHLDPATGTGDDVFKSVRRWLSEPDCLALGVDVEIFNVREVPENHALMDALLKAALEQEDLDPGFVRREVLGPMQALPVRRKLRLIDTVNNTEIDAHDLGVGVSQVIPVIVGAIEPGFSVFSVEQPELHIHPKVQVALADLFVEQIKRLPGQFLLETHSEHLLLRLLRRVRETSEEATPSPTRSLKPDDLSVVVVHCEVDETDSSAPARFVAIPITPDGDFEIQWPRGFFGERSDELFA